jgi:hypothetical protein
MQRTTTRLRSLITGPQLSFLIEAHNGLSAKADVERFVRVFGRSIR